MILAASSCDPLILVEAEHLGQKEEASDWLRREEPKEAKKSKFCNFDSNSTSEFQPRSAEHFINIYSYLDCKDMFEFYFLCR